MLPPWTRVLGQGGIAITVGKAPLLEDSLCVASPASLAEKIFKLSGLEFTSTHSTSN